MSNPVSVGDDLVGDLRDCRDLRKNGALSLPAVNAHMQKVYSVRHKAADRIEALEAQLKAAREALMVAEEALATAEDRDQKARFRANSPRMDAEVIHLRTTALRAARAALNPKAPS